MESVPKLSPRPPAPAALTDPRVQAFARLVGVVDRLRDPDGCPWDRKQTLESMASCLIEESHEARESIESGDDAETAAELGDVLMVVVLLSRIAEQAGRFDLARAAGSVAEKLVRRHPHVFGEKLADTPEQALASWEAVKQGERSAAKQDDSAIAGVPVSLPALQRARRLSSKAVSAGFRWSSARGAFEKLAEEQSELVAALEGVDLEGDPAPLGDAARRARVEHELGDVLLSAAFFACYLDLDPELLCREAGRRFERRFRAMETSLARPLSEHDLGQLLAAWTRAKTADR